MKALLTKLRKRKVIKVGLAYLVVAWLLMQVVDVMFPALSLPDWSITLVAAMPILGFPVALILSWAYEITPEGVRRETDLETAKEAADSIPSLPAVAAPSAAGEKSVAVLPFVDMSAEGDQEYFSDGLTEELMNALAQVPELKVSSRTSSFAFKGTTSDIPAVAEKLSVAFVVEGSVRKAGERLRITAQLIEAASDTHVWSQAYDRELDDIFAIQDDIARKVAEMLRVKLLPGDLPEATTENVEAYEYYLRGRDFFNRLGDKNLRQAVEMFRAATDIDPGFSRAWAGLALAHAYRAMHFGGAAEDKQGAESASQRAIDLGPEIAEIHTARLVALVALSREDEAEAEFNKAVTLNPRDFEAHYQYGRIQWTNGNLQGAVDLFERAREINPDDFQAPILLMTVYHARGAEEKAREVARAGVKAVQAHLEHHPDNPRAYMLGAGALLRIGEKEKGLQYMDRALRIDADSEDTQYNAACFFAAVGQYDKALDCLARGLHDPDWMENDPDLEPLHAFPRFRELMKQARSRI